MSASRLVLFCLVVFSGGLRAQGADSFEGRRQEDAAAAHARKMKSIKEQVVNEPLPRDLESNQDAAPQSITPDLKKTKPPVKPVPKVEVAPAEQGSTVLAVMEDAPATQPGAEPKRRLLGFLSAKGMDAALGAPATVSQAPTKPTTAAGSPGGKQEAPLVAQKPMEESSRKEPLPSGREEPRNGISRWLASTKKEPFKPAVVAPKFTDAGVPKPVANQPATAPADSANLDYVVIKARAPFHVVDTGDGSTQLLELDSGTVGRTHGEGDEWTWMQLDSGLMGLMKKRFVRPAVPGEVVAFLAAEAKSSGTALAQAQPSPVRFVQVDLPEESADQAMEQGLDGEDPAQVIPGADSPSAVMPESAQPEALERIPERPPISSIVPPHSHHPLAGGVAAGVIAVPSPVPILP